MNTVKEFVVFKLSRYVRPSKLLDRINLLVQQKNLSIDDMNLVLGETLIEEIDRYAFPRLALQYADVELLTCYFLQKIDLIEPEDLFRYIDLLKLYYKDADEAFKKINGAEVDKGKFLLSQRKRNFNVADIIEGLREYTSWYITD